MAALKKIILPLASHPGTTLSEKLDEMGMSIKEFAVRTSKPEKTIFSVINGKSSITPDMAIAFENVTKIPAHFWLNRQRIYDERVARERHEVQLTEACDWARSFPFSEMVKLGWVEATRTIEERVKSLFSFFQINSVKAWEDYYCNQQLKIAFRISLSGTKNPFAISAWLRQGELQASMRHASKYSEQKLRAAFPEMKSLLREQPHDFAGKLQKVCEEAGVKLLYTPCLPKAPINGSTRWLSDTPCIQLTGRYKRNDIFWFTFFHEVGHLLLHGKKDVFLEDIDYEGKETEKEREADAFASKILLSESEENEIIENGDFSIQAICHYAEKFDTHPGIIVGRLQHRKKVPYSYASHLIVKVDLF